MVVIKFEGGGGIISHKKDTDTLRNIISVIGVFLHKTVKDGDFFVTIQDSLNVSGYGDTQEESIESYFHNLELYLKEIKTIKYTQ